MRAMVLHNPGQPLQLEERPLPTPGARQMLIKVQACGVCRTDLHLLDGELPQARFPRVPGHEIVGDVVAVGDQVAPDWVGRRVGVPCANTAVRDGRICATRRCSPVASWTVVTPITRLPMRAFVFPSR